MPRPLYAGRCGPAAAHPLRRRRPARLASNSCGSMNVNELINIKDVCESATIFPRPCLQVDLWPFDIEIGVRITCDVGYLCANFGLHRPLCSRVIPDVRDRQTSDVRHTDVRQHHRLMPRLGGGGIITSSLICFAFACLSVSRITQNVVDEFWWNFCEGGVYDWQQTTRFYGDPNQDTDPGIFKRSQHSKLSSIFADNFLS